MLQKFIIEIYMLFLARFPSINHKVLTLARKADGYNVHHKNGGEWLFIKNHLADSSFCIDIGANRGQYASLLLKYTNAKILSFEPNPVVYKKLAKLSDSYADRLEAVNKGVADKNTKMELHHSVKERTGYGSFSKEVNDIGIFARTNTEVTSVEVIKIDDLDLPGEIDLIKMDVEGFEYEVLSGMSDIIKSKKVGYIQLEYNVHQFYRGHNLKSLAELIPGYVAYRLNRYGMIKCNPLSPEAQYYALSNWVFVRDDLAT